MPEIVVDKEKCTKCGLCASDCISYCWDLSGTKRLELFRKSLVIVGV